MNQYKQEYQQKLTTAQEAVKIVNSGDWVDYGWGNGMPYELDKELALRIKADNLTRLKFRGALVLRQLFIFDVENAAQHLCWNSWHMSGVERKMIKSGVSFYAPIKYSELPQYYADLPDPVDVAMFQVAPMDANGYFNFGTNTSHMSVMCGRAKKIVVEVNNKMPIVPGLFDGKEKIHISEIDMIVEGNNRDIDALGTPPTNDNDRKVGELIVSEITDGACLQLGIGGMANAVGSMIADSDLKNLGVHTEMYVDGFVDLAKAGKINGLAKNIDNGKQVYAFGAGSQKMYDYLNENPECLGAPVDYTNDVRVISQLDNFVSINNAVDVDLFGQINAESSGPAHISGAGGQLDFVLGAYLSKGGKSFVCCPSTYKDKDGSIKSRIRPMLKEGSIVTDTRTNAHFIVTEYGKANLKGLTVWERAEAMINIAHPDFREELIREAEKMNIWLPSNRR